MEKVKRKPRRYEKVEDWGRGSEDIKNYKQFVVELLAMVSNRNIDINHKLTCLWGSKIT